MDSPFRTLANILVPAMVIGLILLLVYLKQSQPVAETELDTEDLEERGY